MPKAIVICGANGAGKTSFARSLLPLLHPGVPFLNADEIQGDSPHLAHPIAASWELLKRLTQMNSDDSGVRLVHHSQE